VRPSGASGYRVIPVKGLSFEISPPPIFLSNFLFFNLHRDCIRPCTFRHPPPLWIATFLSSLIPSSTVIFLPVLEPWTSLLSHYYPRLGPVIRPEFPQYHSTCGKRRFRLLIILVCLAAYFFFFFDGVLRHCLNKGLSTAPLLVNAQHVCPRPKQIFTLSPLFFPAFVWTN